MAATKLTPTKMSIEGQISMPAPTTVGASGMELDFSGVDTKILIMNDDTAAATIKAGNGVMSGIKDITLARSKSIVIESGRFKQMSGEHKGTVFIEGATAKISAIELP